MQYQEPPTLGKTEHFPGCDIDENNALKNLVPVPH